jgi:hypothetical protein
MEEPSEQSTVVFTLIPTELASECVSAAGSVTIYAKTAARCVLHSSESKFIKNLQTDSKNIKSLSTSGFWPRVRARLFGHIATPNGALRAPRPLQLRCSPQNKIIDYFQKQNVFFLAQTRAARGI